VATIRLFASARDAAGTGRDSISAATVGEMLDEACRRYGEGFRDVLETSEIWVNGEPARTADVVGDSDEVAVLPPVSGGSGW
jgi:sulfur-carrier protein